MLIFYGFPYFTFFKISLERKRNHSFNTFKNDFQWIPLQWILLKKNLSQFKNYMIGISFLLPVALLRILFWSKMVNPSILLFFKMSFLRNSLFSSLTVPSKLLSFSYKNCFFKNSNVWDVLSVVALREPVAIKSLVF